jgi:DNA-binding MarR family transcriptional regulator
MNDTPLVELIFKKYHWVAGSIINQINQGEQTRLTRAQAVVIAAISQGEHRPSLIATQLGVSRQAVHKTLKELQHQGLVEQQDDPEHKKAVVVTLTDRGVKNHKVAQKKSAEMEQRIIDEFGKEACVFLKQMLKADW